ncbi:MAG: hypothetical protein J6M18_06195 [Actinomycetaceae bacterium]|nr:hypothetical protein [Actinomycetaceae bacterium]
MSLAIEFCGQWYQINPHAPFLIGREGPLQIEDNPYLHRRFLVISLQDGLWWIDNVGSRICATLSDQDGLTQAHLRPGFRLPLVFTDTTLLFTAGSSVYDMRLINDEPAYSSSLVVDTDERGQATVGPVQLTPSQELLLLALSESLLKQRGAIVNLPSAQEASARLGWPVSRFNRKLDQLCERLTNYGVYGLGVDSSSPMVANRRARLAEYAVATRLVAENELYKLDNPSMYDD